jgi:hypothetical protein
VPATYQTLGFTPTFLETLCSKAFNERDRKRLLDALKLLDANERHPSLRVHQLEHDLAGQWSASASASLRMTFLRLENGRKLMLTCSHHYG